MKKKTLLLVSGIVFYVALGIALLVSLRGFSLDSLLGSFASASVVLGAIALAGAILVILFGIRQEGGGGGGIRGASLLLIVLAAPVYYAMQENRAEYSIGYLIAVAIIAVIQLAMSVFVLWNIDDKSTSRQKILNTVLIFPWALFAGQWTVILTRATWAFFQADYALVGKIGLGILNLLWVIACFLAPVILAGVVAASDEDKK